MIDPARVWHEIHLARIGGGWHASSMDPVPDSLLDAVRMLAEEHLRGRDGTVDVAITVTGAPLPPRRRP